MAATLDVSVVIPTRDRAWMVERALAGVGRQRGVRCQVVVVDDGSREEAAARLSTLASNGRIELVRHPTPRGVAAARNTGIDRARAEWIAFLDDDDQWGPDKLRTQLDAATSASAGFVYGPVVVTDGKAMSYIDPAPSPSTLRTDLLAWNVIPAGSSNVMVSAEAIEGVGGWDERFAQMPDWDLWIRLAADHAAATIPGVAVAYVTHADSMLAQVGDDELEREFELLAAKHAERSRQAGVCFDRHRFDRWAALGYRRRGRRARAAAEYLRVGVRHRSTSDLARAAACLLGERAMRVGRPVPATPPWFEPLR